MFVFKNELQKTNYCHRWISSVRREI